MAMSFQSTHPVWGATFAGRGPGRRWRHFNPRTPCGVRPKAIEHALIDVQDFNPRTPCGVRQFLLSVVSHDTQFQSTHPVWGATRAEPQLTFTPAISIHAPRVGCDLLCAGQVNHDTGTFQSTHPVWGATAGDGLGGCVGNISIHAPRVGCDATPPTPRSSPGHFNPRTPCGVRRLGVQLIKNDGRISIHAPRVGCDQMTARSPGGRRNFNPRTPCGVRPWSAAPGYLHRR